MIIKLIELLERKMPGAYWFWNSIGWSVFKFACEVGFWIGVGFIILTIAGVVR